jgi:formamidase
MSDRPDHTIDALRVTVDRTRSLQEARDGGHTRWHPDIEPIARIAPGQVVIAETRDGSDLQIGPTTGEAEAAAYDADRLHPLTGPFHVEGVDPGDVLEVEIIDVEPLDFAWTQVAPGGGGLMREFVSGSLIVRWRLEDGVARSDDLPGVAIPGAPFIGTIGVAPSPELLDEILEREAALVRAGGYGVLPQAKNAVPTTPAVQERGLRTLPPREFGGNMDVKDVGAGSRVSFVAGVPGALLSLGDLHFSQGDGETFGSAIEMSGSAAFRCQVRKAADVDWTPRFPIIETDGTAAARRQRACMITTGISIDANGVDHYMDLNLAAQNALAEMTAYLVAHRGYSEVQAQVIVTAAADLRISVVNNPPNPLVSAALPLDIFE